MGLVWLNGTLLDESEARILITDRGFTLADGVFETILAIGSEPLWLHDHLQRLWSGADQIGIVLPMKMETLESAISELLSSVKSAVSAVRVTLTRGPVGARGLWPNEVLSSPTCLITTAAIGPTHDQNFVICRGTRRNEHSPLSRIKSLSYADNILARREARQRGADDALMMNTRNCIACATVGNVFFRIADRWMTPSLPSGILPGLARSRLIKELDAIEAPLSVEDIAVSDSAFVSNSLGCTHIKSIEGKALPTLFYELPIQSVYS